MEDFINDIYRLSFIIENLKEFIHLTDSGQFYAARSLYNETADMLENLLNSIASTDTATACRIQDIALKIKEVFEDHCHVVGLIEGLLIPELYSYLSDKI